MRHILHFLIHSAFCLSEQCFWFCWVSRVYSHTLDFIFRPCLPGNALDLLFAQKSFFNLSIFYIWGDWEFLKPSPGSFLFPSLHLFSHIINHCVSTGWKAWLTSPCWVGTFSSVLVTVSNSVTKLCLYMKRMPSLSVSSNTSTLSSMSLPASLSETEASNNSFVRHLRFCLRCQSPPPDSRAFLAFCFVTAALHFQGPKSVLVIYCYITDYTST